MHEGKYIETSRIIIARKMKIPPDDIDMFTIFECAKRAIRERVDQDLEEPVLTINNSIEEKAVISEIGETIIPLMFNCEYPFGNFVDDYESYYKTKVKN